MTTDLTGAFDELLESDEDLRQLYVQLLASRYSESSGALTKARFQILVRDMIALAGDCERDASVELVAAAANALQLHAHDLQTGSSFLYRWSL